ncbi:hypothetical protein ACB092_04G039300 [Castanea dentata]
MVSQGPWFKHKRLAYFKAAYALFDANFYVKVDDGIYLRPDHLSLLLVKERSHSQTYLGCMKKGPVFTDPKLKWLKCHVPWVTILHMMSRGDTFHCNKF